MRDQDVLRWFPLIFVGAWVGISLFLSRVGGVAAISRGNTGPTQPITGRRYWMKSASMGGVAYRSIVNFGADSSGLFLSVFPLFRIGNSPLFIPWSDITCAQEKGWFFGGTELRFRKVPGVWLLIPTNLATRMFANGPQRFEAT